jgi:hypothetical protein
MSNQVMKFKSNKKKRKAPRKMRNWKIESTTPNSGENDEET